MYTDVVLFSMKQSGNYVLTFGKQISVTQKYHCLVRNNYQPQVIKSGASHYVVLATYLYKIDSTAVENLE